jgi:hypothetical protein
MHRKHNLRFTGEWPPPEILADYANWEYALDEEGEPGQDETTMRPESEQRFITPATVFTAGEIETNSGERIPAILEMFEGTIEGINALIPHGAPWRIYRAGSVKKWIPYTEDWLSEKDRTHSAVSLADNSLFPIIIRSSLPKQRGERKWAFSVDSQGFATEVRSDGGAASR